MLDVIRFHESVQEDFPDAHWEQDDMYGVQMIGADGLPVMLDFHHDIHTLAVQRKYHTSMMHLEYVAQAVGETEAAFREVDGMAYFEGEAPELDILSKRRLSVNEMARYIVRFSTGAVLLNQAGRDEWDRARDVNRHNIGHLSEEGIELRSKQGLIAGRIDERYLSWLQQPQTTD